MVAEYDREWVEANWEKGTHCDKCGGTVKLYPRQINGKMAASLLTLFKEPPGVFVRIKETIGRKNNNEEGKLVHWGLIEEEMKLREDGGRAGYWRITPAGRDFITKGTVLPQYAMCYKHNELIQMVQGKGITFQRALGKTFDLRELLGQTPSCRPRTPARPPKPGSAPQEPHREVGELPVPRQLGVTPENPSKFTAADKHRYIKPVVKRGPRRSGKASTRAPW